MKYTLFALAALTGVTSAQSFVANSSNELVYVQPDSTSVTGASGFSYRALDYNTADGRVYGMTAGRFYSMNPDGSGLASITSAVANWDTLAYNTADGLFYGTKSGGTDLYSLTTGGTEALIANLGVQLQALTFNGTNFVANTYGTSGLDSANGALVAFDAAGNVNTIGASNYSFKSLGYDASTGKIHGNTNIAEYSMNADGTGLASLGNLPSAAIARTSLTPYAPVPEPSSAALLGLGGLALILRRRK